MNIRFITYFFCTNSL